MKKLTVKPLKTDGRNHNGIVEVSGVTQVDGELEPLIILRGSDTLARRIFKTYVDEADKADYPQRVIQQWRRLHDRCERWAAVEGSAPPPLPYVEETRAYEPEEATETPEAKATIKAPVKARKKKP